MKRFLLLTIIIQNFMIKILEIKKFLKKLKISILNLTQLLKKLLKKNFYKYLIKKKIFRDLL